MTPLHLHQLTSWITTAAVRHPHDLSAYVAERTGSSRPAVRKALVKLIESGWLEKSGPVSKPVFKPGLMRQVVMSYPVGGLQEDLPWARDFAPYVTLPATVSRMMQHIFGEILNNAIEHSGGTAVTVSMRQTASHVQLLISDDGQGLFDHIREFFAIDDPELAMLELSKGKLTSLPDCHTGRGLFFSSQLADVFEIHANGSKFQRRAWEEGRWHGGRPLERRGTSVYASISLDTTRSFDAVLANWSSDREGVEFDCTRVPLRFLLSQGVALDSRAQARRAVSRLQQFRHAEIDFDGVTEVSHSFADELFRVFARQHPEIRLVPANMSPRISMLVQSVTATAG